MSLTSQSNPSVHAGLLFLLIMPVHAQTDTSLPRPDAVRIAATCEACHGNGGQGSGEIPGISSLTEPVFIRKMIDFQSDKTPSTVMNRVAKGYQETDFANLARFFRNGVLR